MTLLHHPRVQHHAKAHLVCRVEGVTGRFALTFDDGPSPTWTPRVLDLLREFGARATFFVLGRNVRRHQAIARRVVAEGHELGVHGDWHLPPPLLPDAWLDREVDQGLESIRQATGQVARFYRPPFGIMTPRQSRRLRASGLLPVLGDIYPRDVERPGVEVIAARIRARLREGSIVILHDSSGFGDFDRGQTVGALRRTLTEALAMGLAGASVSELLDHPEAVAPPNRTGLTSLEPQAQTPPPRERRL